MEMIEYIKRLDKKFDNFKFNPFASIMEDIPELYVAQYMIILVIGIVVVFFVAGCCIKSKVASQGRVTIVKSAPLIYESLPRNHHKVHHEEPIYEIDAESGM